MGDLIVGLLQALLELLFAATGRRLLSPLRLRTGIVGASYGREITGAELRAGTVVGRIVLKNRGASDHCNDGAFGPLRLLIPIASRRAAFVEMA